MDRMQVERISIFFLYFSIVAIFKNFATILCSEIAKMSKSALNKRYISVILALKKKKLFSGSYKSICLVEISMGIRNFRFPFIWVQHSFMDFSLSDFILFSFTKVLLYTRKKSKIRLLFTLCRRLHLLRATFFTFYSVSNVIHATLWLRVF